MVVNETQKITRAQRSRTPWVLLLVVIILYGVSFVYGGVILVWGNLLFIKTGNRDLVDLTATFLGTITIGISFEGLGTMIWSYWMIKGLLNRRNVLRILAYIENGFKLIFYGLIFFGFIISILSGNHPTLAKTIGVGDVEIFIKLYGWWGIPASGILLLLSIFIIYVLSRRDVWELFQKTTPAPSVPEEASG